MPGTWSLPPELVWGLFQRSLGVLFLISFLSLSGQVVALAGSNSGIAVISRRLAKIREDFPTWRRYVYFPTLLWVNSSDGMLRGLPLVGATAAVGVIYGGPIAWWCLLICWLCYLTLDLPATLIFPWDCLLFEATLLGLFLPETLPLPALEAVTAPAPALSWAYRLLMFRLMLGFGKQKFLGSRKQDLAYLKGFLTNQPLLSPLGWYTQKLPTSLLKIGVLFMFFAEIPAPFFAFFPGPLSLVFAASTVFLMIGIQAMGSFGYFSLATMFCCLPLLDNLTPLQLSISRLFAAGEPIGTNAYVLVHTIGACVVFVFNSWVGQSWSLWAFWYQLPRWVQIPLNVFRLLHPFRWLHPYGVFPPNNQPSVKITLLLEVTWDREKWEPVEFAFSPTHAHSRPQFVSPYHPRGDQAVIYDTFGLNPTSLVSAMLGPWDPYYFASRLPALAFCQAVTDGRAYEMTKFGPLQQHATPPIAARITTIMLEPVSLEEHRRTGAWWKRTYIGPHVPAHDHDPEFWQDSMGEPELWHFESIFWRRRSKLRTLIERAQADAADPLELALFDGALTRDDVARFWREFVPLLNGPERNDFATLPAMERRMREMFSRSERRALYRLLGRFSLILVARLEPLYLHQGFNPQIPVRTYFQLWMLAQHVIGNGLSAYQAAVQQPESVVDYIPQMTTQTGLYALALFRFEELVFEAQKLRLIASFVHPHDPEQKRVMAEKFRTRNFDDLPKADKFFVSVAQRVSGFYNVVSDLREAFIGPEYDRGYPEVYPEFRELADGTVVLVRYGAVPGDRPLAKDLKDLPVGAPGADAIAMADTAPAPVIGTR
ncbi:MAG TPA: lipase maturation factor family protein [Polyangiales bacterium]|nr:lipase maturation factor family protein [Polyangiales bacterium]